MKRATVYFEEELHRALKMKSAAKEIERVEKKDRIRIIEKIRSLAEDPLPVGSKKLSGQEKYRIRQGNYRILYQVKNEELIINVVKVGHRRYVSKKRARKRALRK